MNTASLENCKKLYELSGWETGCWWGSHSDGSQVASNTWLEKYRESVAYGLGLLLSKLPRYDAEGWNLTLECMGEEAVIAYYRHSDDRHRYEVLADTPEDAACLLAIKLFDEGILTPKRKKAE